MVLYSLGATKDKKGYFAKKMDRALVTDEWNDRFPQAYYVFETDGCSDDLRCRIQITKALKRLRRPFKFTNAITNLPGFLPLVDSFWKDIWFNIGFVYFF